MSMKEVEGAPERLPKVSQSAARAFKKTGCRPSAPLCHSLKCRARFSALPTACPQGGSVKHRELETVRNDAVPVN